MEQDDATRRLWLGPALTGLGAALTELVVHIIPTPAPVAATVFIVALLPIAYTALIAGFWMGVVSAAIFAVAALHLLAPAHSMLISTAPEDLSGSATIFVIGVAMAAPMAYVRLREERLRQKLRDRAATLQVRNDELTAANATLEAFGYVVSHDLKEPVRALENYLQAAEEEYGSKDGRELLSEAREANRRLSRLLQGLLMYSRTSTSPISPHVLRITEVLVSDTCRPLYEGLLRERGAKLDVAPDLPAVRGDEVVLSQLLGNVIVNAIRHNPKPHPEVRLRSVATGPNRVHLVIEDNGPGFPADVLKRYEGLSSGRPATVKGGFGLVIGHRAAQRLEGRMWLENADGGQVHVELPAAESATAPVAPLPA